MHPNSKQCLGGFNKATNRNGSLFQAKFKRIYIRNSGHFQYILQYIHHNPIHHNYAQDYGQWAHCSYRSFFHDPPPWMAIEPVIKLYSPDNNQDGIAQFLKAHEQFKREFRHSELNDFDL